MNKKGLSQVIGIVLFILLSLSSVVILFGAVNNFLQGTEAKLGPAFSCPTLQSSPSEIINAEYKEGQLQVNVERSFSESIYSFDFVLETDSESERFSCGDHNQCGNCFIQGLGQEKTFYFNKENVQKISLYVNGNCFMDELDNF